MSQMQLPLEPGKDPEFTGKKKMRIYVLQSQGTELCQQNE